MSDFTTIIAGRTQLVDFASATPLDSMELTITDAGTVVDWGQPSATDVADEDGKHSAFSLTIQSADSAAVIGKQLRFEWKGTAGTQVVTTVVHVLVVSSDRSLCTLEQVKHHQQIKDSGSDGAIITLIDALPRILHARYGREFIGHSEETRTFPVWNHEVLLKSFDLRAATSVVLHPEEGARTLLPMVDYALLPEGGDELTNTYTSLKIASGIPIVSKFSRSFGHARLSITGSWGIWGTVADVPADINQAAIETVASWLSKPANTIAALDGGDPALRRPPATQTWDIPTSAYHKFRQYVRPVSVY